MAKYRKIDPRIWNDEKFRSLSDQGKLVFLFILTHPHLTSLGAMRASLDGLASELGWTSKGFRERFAEPFRNGLLRVDERASFVVAPNFLKYNPPDNPNVVVSWKHSLDLLPECTLKNELIKRVKQLVERLPKGFAERLPEVFAKPSRTQEQEQEQEYTPIVPSDVRTPPNAFDSFWKIYPRKIGKLAALKAWKKIKPSPDMVEAIMKAIEEQAVCEQWSKDNGQFIPYPATWLNQGRWEDEIEARQDKYQRL